MRFDVLNADVDLWVSLEITIPPGMFGSCDRQGIIVDGIVTPSTGLVARSRSWLLMSRSEPAYHRLQRHLEPGGGESTPSDTRPRRGRATFKTALLWLGLLRINPLVFC